MQISGIGSSHSDMHHVTNCIHDYKKPLEGNLQVGAKAASARQTVAVPMQQREPFTLTGWLQNALKNARNLLGKIGIGGTNAGQTPFMSGEQLSREIPGVTQSQQLSADIDVIQEDVVASVLVQPGQSINNNPYFAAITENTTSRHTPLQKMKVRFRDITGFLARKFSFTNGEHFQAKQERSKEDLRRRSNYRKDDLEMECVIKDDSYLMDSYNKKGEYSKLSADK